MDPFKLEKNASLTPPDPPASPSEGFPSNGAPQTGTPASKPGEYWFYAVGMEIFNVISGAELTPDHTTLNQLFQAIQALIAASSPTVSHDRVYKENATFAPGVTDGKAVYYDSGNSRFDLAIADGSAAQNVRGIADVTNSEVTLFGPVDGLLSGLTPGAYYLSDTTAGEMTATPPAQQVRMGIAKSATEFAVDIDPSVGAATTSQKGIVELATDAEAAVGTDTERAMTPANFFSLPKSLASDGYITLPGGLILQWGNAGTFASNNQSKAITFPLAFPTACLLASPLGSSGKPHEYSLGVDEGASTSAGSVATTGFTIVSRWGLGTNGQDIYWIAVGY